MREIVASLRGGMETSNDVLAAFEELDLLPAEIVREELAPWVGDAPDPERLDDATRTAHGFRPRPLRLKTLAVARDADVLDLGDIAEEQLRIAGKSWDGVDLEPEERLDGEIEGSFAGTLERRVLGEEQGTPLFDVLRYAGDAGIVFAAGTTTVVAMIADGLIETTDRRARDAIGVALAAAVESSDDAADKPAKKAARKKSSSKASPRSKTTARAKKKTAAKKTAPKKAAPKKTAPKKTAAKKRTTAR